MSPYLTVKEAAEFARCPELVIREAVNDRSLPARKLGKRHISINKDDLIQWIESRVYVPEQKEADNGTDTD